MQENAKSQNGVTLSYLLYKFHPNCILLQFESILSKKIVTAAYFENQKKIYYLHE